MNVICFTANLGGDAETRFTTTQKAITSFNAALSSGWGDKKTTTWMRCNMWGERGQKVAPFLTKGQQVAVTGEFSTREWQGKDGVTKTSCEVNVTDVTLVGEKKAPQQQKAPKQSQQADVPEFSDDDIPF